MNLSTTVLAHLLRGWGAWPAGPFQEVWSWGVVACKCALAQSMRLGILEPNFTPSVMLHKALTMMGCNNCHGETPSKVNEYLGHAQRQPWIAKAGYTIMYAVSPHPIR